ncbi:rRNA biogenesis protein rrp36 [Ascosphaera aggregata]|nr:rRNA biogenesis protein rrp36 [Ascosphaera aggregata]
MMASRIFNQRVKPWKGEAEEDEFSGFSSDEDMDVTDVPGDGSGDEDGDEYGYQNTMNAESGEEGDAAAEEDSEGMDEEENEEDESGSNSPSADTHSAISDISFGALAKAQASLGKRKRTAKDEADEKAASRRSLDEVRNQLLALRAEREKERAASGKKDASAEHKRASKHAPMTMSTKHAVTRRRTVVEPLPTPKARDPRFDSAIMGNSLPRNPGAMGNAAEVARQRYSFLNDYRKDEITTLRKQMAQTKNLEEKERLKRQITSMSDRQRAHQRKEYERKIRSEHKKKERELIREGKKSKAYYLKDSEVKKQAQVARFKEMSGRQKQKALEHRRKKIASKERKDMPWARRNAEDT